MKITLYFSVFITLLLIAGISCTKEEDTPVPSIEFKTGIEFISADTTLIVDTEFTIGIIAESNTAKNITNVTITRKIDGGTPVTEVNAITSAQSLDSNWIFITSSTDGFFETFTVEVSDANDMSSSVSLTVNTLPADPGIIVYKNKILRSFQDEHDHFFAVSNGMTYDTADCKNEDIQEIIDFGYFDDTTYRHTLMSPDVDFLHKIYPSVLNWNYKNTTRFSETELTLGTFDAIGTIEQFTNAMDNAVTAFNLEFVPNLEYEPNNEEKQVIAFITKNKTRGLLKVNSTQSSSNSGESTITFDVKIEKKEQ